MTEAVVESRSRSKALGWLVLKLAITAAAFGFIFWRQPLRELVAAARGMSVLALLAAIAIQVFAIVVATVRWRALLRAYGARKIPPFGALLRVYFVGMFYNTYLPGAVGGDVLRGVLTRQAFATDGTARAVAVVFIERVLGVAGLMTLTCFAVSCWASESFVPHLHLLSGLAALAAVTGAIALGNGRRIVHLLPHRLAELVKRLPDLVSLAPFGFALLLSVATHTLVAVCGHVLVHSMWPTITPSQSFLAMPLAAAAGYFPLTVAGAGARDLAMVQLYMLQNVPRATAVATALAFLMTTLVSAGIGGLVQWLAPLDLESKED